MMNVDTFGKYQLMQANLKHHFYTQLTCTRAIDTAHPPGLV